MEDGPELISSGADVYARSTEEEKAVNVKKLKVAYIAALNRMLNNNFHDWQFKTEPQEDDTEFVLNKGSNSVILTYQPDGLQIHMKEVNDQSIALMVSCLGEYQKEYVQHHPNTQLNFELICNDKEEALMILQQALTANSRINISELKFYPEHEGEAPTNQNALLAQLKQELLDEESKHRPGRSLRDSQ